MTNNEIWIIDDDVDDKELVEDILKKINPAFKIRFFGDASTFLKCLEIESISPFIILSDIHLPGISGLELRKAMLNSENQKFHSVPFIFWTTSASDQQIELAFHLNAHGFFIKDYSYEDWNVTFSGIVNYWHKSKTPIRIQEQNYSTSI